MMANKINRMFNNFTELFRYPKICAGISKKTNFYFFFPRWSIGGAERVHIDILNLFKDQNPLCFITSVSPNSGFKKESKAVASTINLGRWGEKNAYKTVMFKKIADAINANKSPVVFGSNSQFMYELIPFLGPHVKIIDLIHNFSDDDHGIELFSLPYVSRIQKRIVVGKNLIRQFEELYERNHISNDLLKRLTVIQNKIPFNNFFPKKNYDNKLDILFVARNSPEKRINVLIRIAELCQQINLPVTFKMIGNFNSERKIIPANTEIIGEVSNKTILDNYYKNAHLLLLTSQRESWGLVIFEGMNFGVVPISTDVGELSNYITVEKENGVLIQNLNEIESLAELFVKQIERFHFNRIDLKKFSKNAFEMVKELSNTCEFELAYKRILLEKQQ